MSTHWFNRKSLSFIGTLVLAAVILAACQPAPAATSLPAATSMPAATSAPVATTAPEATAAPSAASASAGAVVAVASDAKLGQILVDSKGMTLYMYTKDGPDKSNCSGGCAKAWPPLLSKDKPQAGSGVDASLLGTAKLADGSEIVTYNHMPLYYWMNDAKPGDTTGQGNKNVWYVVAPDGKAVGMQSLPVTGATSAPAATTAPAVSAPSTSADVSVMVATDPKLGQILVDGKGMTLYMFKKDGPDQSNCGANCLKAWPPLLSQGKPQAGSGADASLLGTAKLADGTLIVTYNHMPLYFYMNDAKAGDTTGQGVGSVWYVVSPDGKPVTGGSGY